MRRRKQNNRAMLDKHRQELTDINESGRFPFPVSVAYGIVRSSEHEPIALCDAIKEADRRMSGNDWNGAGL